MCFTCALHVMTFFGESISAIILNGRKNTEIKIFFIKKTSSEAVKRTWEGSGCAFEVIKLLIQRSMKVKI